MNIIKDKLPTHIVARGKSYPVYTDFRNWLKIDAYLRDTDMDFCEKLSKIFALCYKKLPESISDAIDGVFEFLNCAKDIPKNDMKRSIPVFSFEHDADLLYAAFFSQYGINLAKDNLHWFEFMALISGLWDIHKISKIALVRAIDLSEIENKTRKKQLSELKRRFALPDSRTEQQKSEDIANNMADLF